jgi:hypothetical protein
MASPWPINWASRGSRAGDQGAEALAAVVLAAGGQVEHQTPGIGKAEPLPLRPQAQPVAGLTRRQAELIQLLELLGRGHHPQQHAAIAAAQQAGALQIEHDPQPTTLERAAADRQQRPGRQVEPEICAPHHWRHPQGLQQVGDRNRHLVGQVALACGGNLELAAEPLEQQGSVGGLAAAHTQLPLQHLQGQPEFAIHQFPAGLLPQAVHHHPLAGAAGRALEAGLSSLRCWQRRWHPQRHGPRCIRSGADGGDAQRQNWQ